MPLYGEVRAGNNSDRQANAEIVAGEAALDGIYAVVTNLPREKFSREEAVAGCTSRPLSVAGTVR